VLVRIGVRAYLEPSAWLKTEAKELNQGTLRSKSPTHLDYRARRSFDLKQKTEGPERHCVDPESGEAIYLLFGQYGPYLQRARWVRRTSRPKRVPCPKGPQA